MVAVSVEISVVICTLDRADLVRAAVTSLARQDTAAGTFEVLVVDNSPDASAIAALEDLASTVESLRFVHEPTTGLSHARNRGAREAAGEVVLFMDDDALAEPQLLGAHLAAFRADPAVVATGGRIHLRWPVAEPPWLPAALRPYYSGLDLGDAPRRLALPEYPYGANMAIRRDLLDRVGGFSIDLGRQGRSLLSGEEKDLFRRIGALGGEVWYAPDAVVHHCVLPDRISRRWLLRRSYAQGRSDIAMGAIAGVRPARGRLAARTALHAARAGRHGVAVPVALLRRDGRRRAVQRASQSMRWLGAAREGLALLRR